MSKPPSKSVFVGNIPYGLTEEQIVDIFSSAGKVLNFRLVYDRETGRPKGFGFAEYPDSDSAASAVRNLNDYEIMNRKLRVDFSNDGAEEESAIPTGYPHSAITQNGTIQPPPTLQNGTAQLPPLPQGIDLPPGTTCPDSISRTLHTLPPAQLLDVLSQMKALVVTDPIKATELLNQAPQLSYAIFQALLLMGLVSPEALTAVVEQASASAPVAAPPASSVPVPQVQGYPTSITHQGGYPATYAPQPPHLAPQRISTPPVGAAYPTPIPQAYRPPQHSAREQAAAAMGLTPGPDTDALIKQIMDMPLEVINSLQPAERDQLLTLKAAFS